MKPRTLQRTIFTAVVTAVALAGFSVWRAESQEPASPLQTLGGERAKIVVDDQTGVVQIEIDGKRAVWIDAQGLHVENDVTYGGSITDVGPTIPDQGE